MSELFDLFQSSITDTQDYVALFENVKKYQKELSGLELVHSDSLLRLCMTLRQWCQGKAGISDVTVLIRQVIRSYRRSLLIPTQLWNAICTYGMNVDAGLRAAQIDGENLILLTANDWQPDWLTHTAEIDTVGLRKRDESIIGDGLLFAMSNGVLTHYQSLAQKVAVQSCFFAPPGSTLLIALSTGAGKSLLVQLPAWYESLGGTIKGGTTIVIVPTVSLALDQERRIQQFFSSTAYPEYEPYSWTRSTSAETKATICRGILDGTLPLLFVSPEALLKSALYHICLIAAERGTLNRFVIDEAHLVETWGAGFRTEFQLLAAYQKRLLENSHGQLRTLLLSATISRSCADLLKQLFGSGEHYYTIYANRLRPELAYWFRFSQTKSRREQRVLEALQYLPRPLILYVATPQDAKHWTSLLKEHAYRRYEMFTGDTNHKKRQQLIDSWINNDIDIMIATTAFGVGMDKRNVRAVLHACLPENLERFYQEVGRASRDGYNAVSLVCTTIHDNEATFNMTRTARITTEKAAERWQGMRETAYFPFEEMGDILLLDTNSPPKGSPRMKRSEANKEWNMHTLLLMQRAGLLDIMNFGEVVSSGNAHHADSDDWLPVRLLAPTITAYLDTSEFREHLNPIREEEVSKIHQDLKDMEKLVRKYASSPVSECLAPHFADLYAYCSRACGGCPYCRKEESLPYEEIPSLEIQLEAGPVSASLLHGELRDYMGWHATVNISWDGLRRIQTLEQYIHVLVALVQMGMQQLLLPSELLSLSSWTKLFIKQLTKYEPVPHVILTLDEIQTHPQIPLYAIPTVIMYPIHDEDADEFHRFLRQHRQRWHDEHVPLIHIVHHSLSLASEQGLFLDRIDGISETITHFSDVLTQWQRAL